MKLTILQLGETPARLRGEYDRYLPLFETMFASAGAAFGYQSVHVLDGEALPDAGALDGVVLTGSAAGVYEDHAWLGPVRDFIRAAYEAKTPMLGICFGHQIMADALGGVVKKSEKGWSLGRHIYRFKGRPDFFSALPDAVAMAASHQDQVIEPPESAEVFLSSDFTPNAGLVYRNGAAVSLQPHPEFTPEFARKIVGIRRNNPYSDETVDAALATLDDPLDSPEIAKGLARFFDEPAKA